MSFACAITWCAVTFEHPGSESDCSSIDGKCEHLIRAGWIPVWVVIEYDGLRVTASGGWLCPDCSAQHGVRLRRSMLNTRPTR